MCRLHPIVFAAALALGCSAAWGRENEPGEAAATRAPAADAAGAEKPGQNDREKPGEKTPGVETPLRQKIARSLQNLGSSFDDVADAAEAELLAIGFPATDAVKRAADDPNPDVARRAGRLLPRLPAFTHTVLDATGGLITGGTLEVPVKGRKAVFEPNAQANVSIPAEPGSKINAVARFCHPSYGCCKTAINIPDDAREFVVPLVKRDSGAMDRALRGVLLDPDGRPIANQQIRISGLHSSANLPIVSPLPSTWMLTDEKGRFAYYPPIKSEARALRQLIPANCTFDVHITPDDASLFAYFGKPSNLTEVTIKLQRPTKFHKFKFEKPGGGVYADETKADREKLAAMPLIYQRDRSGDELVLDKKYVLEGGKLPPGSFRVVSNSPLTFLPLVVNDDSPEELIFRVPSTLTLAGKVVDGISGKPLVGALVLTYGSIGELTVADLTVDDWKALREFPLRQMAQHAIMLTLTKIYRPYSISRTNDKGEYRIEVHPDQPVYALVALAENYLPLQERWKATAIDGQQHGEVTDLPLFPAATVQVKLARPGRGSMLPSWNLEADGQPEWLPKFRAAEEANRHIEREHLIFLNRVRRFYVPAEVNLKVEFQAPYGQDLATVRVPTAMTLKPGELRDLGEIAVRQAPKLTVQVVDAKGAPIKNADVRRVYQDGAADVPHSTDDKGETTFFVQPQSSGRFVVDVPTSSGSSDAPNLSAAFEIGEDAAPREPYKITLSDAQVQALTRPQPKAE